MNLLSGETEVKENLKSTDINNENLINRKIIQANNDLIQDFIINLISLIDLINKNHHITEQPNNEISYSKIENENKYKFFSSALFTKNKKYLFFNVGKIRYIIRRRIYFEVALKENMVKININEKHLSVPDSIWLKRYKDKFIVNINKLDKNIQDKLIDWLVFRISSREFLQQLPLHKKK